MCTAQSDLLTSFNCLRSRFKIFTDAPKKKYEELDVQKHIPEVFYKTGGL